MSKLSINSIVFWKRLGKDHYFSRNLFHEELQQRLANLALQEVATHQASANFKPRYVGSSIPKMLKMYAVYTLQFQRLLFLVVFPKGPLFD